MAVGSFKLEMPLLFAVPERERKLFPESSVKSQESLLLA
jgi:hypothetical protein